jgi:hypothetical protein
MQAVDSQPHPFSSFRILLKNIMPVVSETGNDKRYLKNAGGREVIQSDLGYNTFRIRWEGM